MVQNEISCHQVRDVMCMMKSVLEYNWDLWTRNEEVIRILCCVGMLAMNELIALTIQVTLVPFYTC